MTSTRFCFLIAAALAGGCGSSAPPQTASSLGSADPGASSRRGAAPVAATDVGGGVDAAGCSVDPVYFTFDSSELDAASRERLSRATRCLSSRPTNQVTVTGMADPRGTEEYNLALGERRARTVSGYIESLGVDGAKISVHSLGEEMAHGRDESGWARDRRAEVQPR